MTWLKFIFMTTLIAFMAVLLMQCQDSDYGSNEINDDEEKSYVAPNPFSPKTGSATICIAYINKDNTIRYKVKVSIDNYEHRNVWNFSHEDEWLEVAKGVQTNEIKVAWSGSNDEGTIVSPGLYLAHVLVEAVEQKATEDTESTYAGGVAGIDFSIIVQ